MKRSHTKRILIPKIKFLNEPSYCLVDGNDINEVSEKVDQAIKCAKKWLTPSVDCLIFQQKREKDTIFHDDIPRKKYKPLDQRKIKHYYSGRVGKKADMIKQFYKDKIFTEKKADKK